MDLLRNLASILSFLARGVSDIKGIDSERSVDGGHVLEGLPLPGSGGTDAGS